MRKLGVPSMELLKNGINGCRNFGERDPGIFRVGLIFPVTALLLALNVGNDKFITDIGPRNDICQGNSEARNVEG